MLALYNSYSLKFKTKFKEFRDGGQMYLTVDVLDFRKSEKLNKLLERLRYLVFTKTSMIE